MQLLKRKGKIWKQPEYPLRDEWIEKMWYGRVSYLNKEANPAICDHMSGLRRYSAE